MHLYIFLLILVHETILFMYYTGKRDHLICRHPRKYTSKCTKKKSFFFYLRKMYIKIIKKQTVSPALYLLRADTSPNIKRHKLHQFKY